MDMSPKESELVIIKLNIAIITDGYCSDIIKINTDLRARNPL